MGNYHCKICGETASSKCVASRNVFPTNQVATMIGNLIKIDAVRMGSIKENWRRAGDSNLWQVSVTFSPVEADDDMGAMQKFIRLITETKPELLKIIFCDHVWVLDSDTCQLGCCKKDLTA